MKILAISVRSDIGGGPKHLLDLCAHLPKNCEMYLAIPSNGEFYLNLMAQAKNHKVIPFRRFSLLAFFRMLYFCFENKIKVVHSHGRGAGIYSRLMKLFGFRVIHTFHGLHLDQSFKSELKLLTDSLLKYLTDDFICVSKSEKDMALTLRLAIPSRTHVIPNGVFALKNERILRNEPPIIIGTLCRFDHVKGLDILVDYIECLKKTSSFNFKVNIAGDGELFFEIAKRIREKNLSETIILVGPTNKPMDFLETLDIYVSFSRSEGMPLSLLEAMGQGLPCLVSDVCGNNDLVDGIKTGLKFDLNRYDDFIAKITLYFENFEMRKEHSRNAKKLVLDYYTIDKMAQKTADIYNDLTYLK